jgi:hypothetical protein
MNQATPQSLASIATHTDCVLPSRINLEYALSLGY